MRLPDWLRSRSDAPLAEEAADRRQRALDMGRRLREQRVRSGLTPIDVERDTRINRVYIEALEDGEFDVLPAPVYARGFMRSYARYLGLDPEEAVAAVPRDLPRPPGLEPMPGLRRTLPPTLPALPALTPRTLLALALAAVLLVALVLGVPRFFDEGPLAPTDAAPVATTAAPTPATTPVPGAFPLATVPAAAEGTAPDFRGVTREAAIAAIEALGALPLVVEAPHPTAPPGVVFDQDPAPGAPLSPGQVVTLFLSEG